MDNTVEYYSSGSLARELDLELFMPKETRRANEEARRLRNERRKEEEERKRQAAIEKERSRAQSVLYSIGIKNIILTLLMCVVVLVALCILVVNGQRVNDLSATIRERTQEITELEQEYEAMELAFASKMSDAAIEKYCIEVLGMQHRENNQTEYLSLHDDNIFDECAGRRSRPEKLWDDFIGFFS